MDITSVDPGYDAGLDWNQDDGDGWIHTILGPGGHQSSALTNTVTFSLFDNGAVRVRVLYCEHCQAVLVVSDESIEMPSLQL